MYTIKTGTFLTKSLNFIQTERDNKGILSSEEKVRILLKNQPPIPALQFIDEVSHILRPRISGTGAVKSLPRNGLPYAYFY